MLYVSEPWNEDLSHWALLLPFVLLAVSPYLVLAGLARGLRRDAAKSRIVLTVALLVTVPALVLYALGFQREPDAQYGLLFLFMPVYQFIAGAVVFTALWFLVTVLRRRRVR